MKQQNTIEFSDLLSHAETLGYSWNKAHDILDSWYPSYGPTTISRYMIDPNYDESEAENYETNEDAQKILVSFFETSKVDEFVILPKSC